MKKVYYFIFIISPAILLSGCHTHTFIPQTQNVPLFTDKDQSSLNVAFTYRSLELQTAFSPVKNLGIMINAMGGLHSGIGEIGAGYFYSPDKKFIAEIYGGYGRGFNRFEIEKEEQKSVFGPTGYYNHDINIITNRFFIQPNIGIRFNDKINLAFSLKTCYWSFPTYYYDYQYWERGDASGSYHILKVNDSTNVKNGSQITYEPAITFRVGGKYGKFMIQTGASFYHYEGKDGLYPYNPMPFFIRFGATVNINYKEYFEERN